jgi:Family of unknown function (DUF6452)
MIAGTRLYFSFIILFFLSITISSCGDEYTLCNISKDVRFVAGFYQKGLATDVPKTAPLMNVFSLPNNSVLYDNIVNATLLAIPLTPNLSAVDSAKYSIKVNATGLLDTITIVYTTQVFQISNECGGANGNTIVKMTSTKHFIDSVKVTKPSVINDQLQNAKIYF